MADGRDANRDPGTAESVDEGGADGEDRDPVELGLALVERFADDELSVADTITRLESITSHPRTQRRILDAAVERGLVERDGSRIRPSSGSPVDFESEVVTKEGDFTCRRCGSHVSTGYFLNLHVGELGPFGSSCIRKVTGRE